MDSPPLMPSCSPSFLGQHDTGLGREAQADRPPGCEIDVAAEQALDLGVAASDIGLHRSAREDGELDGAVDPVDGRMARAAAVTRDDVLRPDAELRGRARCK